VPLLRCVFRGIFRDLSSQSPTLSESMVGSTRTPRFLFMIAPLTSFCCPIGKIRSFTSLRMTRDWPSPLALISWLLSTRRSNPAHGHKASFGVLVHRFVTSLRLSSTIAMISFQRSALPVRIFCSYLLRASMFWQPRKSDLESVYVLTTRKSKTNSICLTTNSTTSRKMVDGIASGKPLET
jgi:hypothetical protein